MTYAPDPSSTSLFFFGWIHCVCLSSKRQVAQQPDFTLALNLILKSIIWICILLNDSGAGVLSFRTEGLLCSFSWFINIPFPLPSTGAQTLVSSYTVSPLGSFPQMKDSLDQCFLVPCFCSFCQISEKVFVLSTAWLWGQITQGHLLNSSRSCPAKLLISSMNSCSKENGKKAQLLIALKHTRRSTGVAHTRPFGSESLGKGRYFWNACMGPPRSFIGNCEDKWAHICSHSVSCGF